MRFAGLGVAVLIAAACAQPVPTTAPNPTATPLNTPSGLTSPPTPTRSPEPTPAPTLALHGIEIFPGGSAPAGWFVASDATPSDPSIVYQILIATAIR